MSMSLWEEWACNVRGKQGGNGGMEAEVVKIQMGQLFDECDGRSCERSLGVLTKSLSPDRA
jgi:hypothetical protein